MRTAAPYRNGDPVTVLVPTDRGTTLAAGTVTDCSPAADGCWDARVLACGTEHRFTVARDGSHAHGYLERSPRVAAAGDGTGTP